jgi:hypothetical protein
VVVVVSSVTLIIERVDEITVGRGLRQFCVTGYRSSERGVSEVWQLETLSQWKALACRRAKELRRLAKIEWTDGAVKRWGGRFPKQIVSVEILS